MPTTKRKTDFFASEEGVAIVSELRKMANDTSYHTESTYSADALSYPNNLIPFVDKHMNYLMQHQGLNPKHYLANLKLMTKIK